MTGETVDYGKTMQGNAMEQVPGNVNDYYRNYLIGPNFLLSKTSTITRIVYFSSE